VQIILLDHHARPDQIEQLELRQQLARPLEQDHQQIECAGPEPDRPGLACERPLAPRKAERPEPDFILAAVHRNS